MVAYRAKLWAAQIHKFLIDLYIRTQKGTIPIENIQLEKEKWQKLCTQAINAEEIILATGCFRTADGAKRYARIQSFISTCRKNNINVFEQLKLLAFQ